MNKPINILILSCGTRNKVIQYFRNELNGLGKVIATDSSELAPALYDADKYYIVPLMSQEGYISRILEICKEEEITGVFSLIDPEISLLAAHKQDFLSVGTTPIVSDFKEVEMCFDKFKMYKFLIANEFKTMKTYIEKEEFYSDFEMGQINFPVFVKPVKGSASININKVETKEELDSLFARFDNLMIQEYMSGKEYGADVYIDLFSGEVVSCFIKEKLKMRAGETDKAVSVKSEEILGLIKELVKKAQFKGVIDIDIFELNNQYYISEVNPRFGGGYPHAYESKVNFPQKIVENLKMKQNDVLLNNYEENIFMAKYNEIKIFKEIQKKIEAVNLKTK